MNGTPAGGFLNNMLDLFRKIASLTLFLGIFQCGYLENTFFSSSDSVEVGEIVELDVNFLSGNNSNLFLASPLTNVKMAVTGCISAYSPTDFLFNGNTVGLHLNDIGCRLSLCSFSYQGINYPNQSPPCGVFDTTNGAITSFTSGTGEQAYAFVSKQFIDPVSAGIDAEFYILQTNDFPDVNFPINEKVIVLDYDNPSTPPYTVADTDASVSFEFKLLYPNPPPTSAFDVYYEFTGSAIDGRDYTDPGSPLSFPANSTSTTLTVPLVDATTARPTQSLGIQLVESSGGQGIPDYLGYGNPTVQITNNDNTYNTSALDYQGTPTSHTTSGSTVTVWNNDFGNTNIIFDAVGSPQLLTGASGINGFNTISFDGTNDYLELRTNRGNINSANSGYVSKLITVVFRTSSDITTRQVIYEQGDAVSGINMYIYNSKLYVSTWESSSSNINVSANILGNQTYSASLDFHSNNGLLRLYLIGNVVGEIAVNDRITKSTDGVGIGGNAGTTKFEDNSVSTSSFPFNGDIAELFHYDRHPLVQSDILALHTVLNDKYNINFPSVSLSAVRSSLGEFEGSTEAFKITRSSPSASPLTVYYSTSGSAISGTNYAVLSGSVTIPAYDTDAFVFVDPLNDGTSGTDVELTLTLLNDVGGGSVPVTYLGAPASASLDIIEYGAPASATLAARYDAGVGVTTAGGDVTEWLDQSGNGLNATRDVANAPTSVDTANPPYIEFNGTSTANAENLIGPNSNLVNTGTITEKTFAFVFQTGSDVTSRQVIYKQGNRGRGLNIVMDSGNLYFTAYFNNNWTTTPNFISTPISTNTLYFFIFEFDQPNDVLRGKINGTVMTPSGNGMGTLNGVSNSVAIGSNLVKGIRFFDNSRSNTDNDFFLKGGARLYEALLFDGLLDASDYSALESYLNGKYGL